MNIGTHKTSIKTTNSLTSVRYWATDVVQFDNDKITLNNGGWYTSTTKRRMNETSEQFNLGFKVYQRNYDWLVDYKGKTYCFESNKLVLNR
tara:strand:+ start:1313 stop:1585 length:273 start_codon:yes stop_codon:yes gene_type:complete